MDSSFDLSSSVDLDNPPTLVAESQKVKVRVGYKSSRMSTESTEDKTAMPVLEPSVDSGTRSKSGRIRKPARNFTSDEYVVPNLVKRRIPATNSRQSLPLPVKSVSPVTVSRASPPPPPLGPAPTLVDVEAIRASMECKFPNALTSEDPPFPYIVSICLKEPEDPTNKMCAVKLQLKVKECYKHWMKGPYRIKEEEIKFIEECIIKPEWFAVPLKDWRILVEILKHRTLRMRKRFDKPNRLRGKKRRREDVKKAFLDLGNKFIVGKQLAESEDEAESDVMEDPDEDFEVLNETEDSSNPSSRISTRSKDPARQGLISSKASSVANDADMDLSLGSTGIDDFAGEDIKDEFDDLDNELDGEIKSRESSGNSMVAALHATLQKDGGPEFDPSQYEPPALEKDSPIFNLDDMEGSENSCNFFENIKEPSFDNAETPTGLTDEAFAELEQRVDDEDVKQADAMEDDFGDDVDSEDVENARRFDDEKMDMGNVEVEESSGNIRLNSEGGREFASPGVTRISIKTALLCALKISEDFLPSPHEKYLDRLEETDKYHHDDLDEIRRRLNMRPSPHAAKRKMKLNVENDQSKKAKVSLKAMNGSDKPKALPFLRSAYAKCRKFMEDETTVIEKLGNNKILAAGRVIEIEYENYLKEADVEIPYDDMTSPMPSLPPPTVSNCHAPSCRLGCICSSISEDMPPRKHCGRPRCFFECTCQNILLNSNDDGDIRSRLRPRVSLLNWRAESTEKEKEPMTSYRQMERGTHFIRMRRNPVQPERLRREFVLDGKVVDRNVVKANKDRFRTKALLQSSHRRMMAKPVEGHGHRFVRIVPASKQEFKTRVNVDQLKKKCTPLTVDVEHLSVKAKDAVNPQKKRILTPEQHMNAKMTAKDFAEMKSIIQEMTEDYQILVIDNQIGFFSWAKGIKQPKVLMYQVMQGDDALHPWLYLPIPPQGHSWICHQLTNSFEKTDFVFIPEIKCCISAHALKINMNTAMTKKKPVVFDVKSGGNPSGMGKIYFFPDLPKVLVCGPFKTDQSTGNTRDTANLDRISTVLEQMDKSKGKVFGEEQTWKRFVSTPTVFPIKPRNDRETCLTAEESRRLFQQIYPNILKPQTPEKPQTENNSKAPKPTKPTKPIASKVSLDWSRAVKFVGLQDVIPSLNKEAITLTEIITL